MNLIKITILIVLLLFTFCAYTQFNDFVSFEYSYDNAGNRIKRAVIEMPKKEQLLAEIDSTLKDNEIMDDDILASNNGLKNNIDEIEISVYPNPVRELLRIDIIGLNGSENINSQLIDLQGKVVRKERIKVSSNVICFSDIQPGTYFLQIFIDNKYQEYKIIRH